MLPILLLLAAAPDAPAPEAERHVTARATITEYGPMPTFGSGYLMVLRPVYVTMASGEKRKLYFIHAGTDEQGVSKPLDAAPTNAYPAIGTTCDFETVSRHIASDELGDGGPDAPIGELIQKLSC
jgi:hypothetical protein